MKAEGNWRSFAGDAEKGDEGPLPSSSLSLRRSSS
jgi:hypothetical protein